MEVPFIEEPHLAGCKTLFELAAVLPKTDLVSAIALANTKLLKGNFDVIYDMIRDDHMDPLYENLWGTSETPANDFIAVLKGTITILEERSAESKSL